MWRLLIAGAALAVYGQQHAQESAAASAAVERGRAQFVQACSFCHGVDAAGGEGPNLVRSPLVRHDSDGNLIAPVIRSGRPAKGMPPIPLTAEQIADVVAFLHARVRQSDLASPKEPGKNFDLQRLLTGDRAAGKAYFEKACAKCHSADGDLAHIATKYEPAALQARFLYPDSEVPPPVTITLRSGERIEGTLVAQDEFEIGIRDKNGWYRSWPCERVKVQVHDPLEGHKELLAKYSNADIHNLFAYLETLK